MELRPDVVAGKYDPSKFDETGRTLLVNEIFYSIQGEGCHAGQATVFIRLAKCNLACRFCDTEFETYRTMQVADIVRAVNVLDNYSAARVTLTGGEPMLQNCGPLITQLTFGGYRHISIETSGSVWSDWARSLAWITVSPKVKATDIPEPLKDVAHEYKWIVNAAFLKQIEERFALCYMEGKLNYLQPEWGPNREKYTTAAVKLVQKFPNIYRISLQTHKLMNVP